MSISDKLKKIKDVKKLGFFKVTETEKTGVVNSLVLLGSIASFFAAVEHEVQAAGMSPTCDANTGEITDTNLLPANVDSSTWNNHCWSWGWGWCWSWGWGWSFGAGK